MHVACQQKTAEAGEREGAGGRVDCERVGTLEGLPLRTPPDSLMPFSRKSLENADIGS
jgi:hypothetical protein